jgi:hypothetical protein
MRRGRLPAGSELDAGCAAGDGEVERLVEAQVLDGVRVERELQSVTSTSAAAPLRKSASSRSSGRSTRRPVAAEAYTASTASRT